MASRDRGLVRLEGNMMKLESLKACLGIFCDVSAAEQLLVLEYVFTGKTIPWLRRVRASAAVGAVDR